ncbi:tetratricopeptide repeat protein [Alkalicoccus chagannorensis]|uniref:tetratricopeptide repeat protein n=1 Tax=Alkalicoccus chagannorensis TaxID=427072 RepID=UPI00041CEF2C|nr:hypothetical protein [Alkalicoccus chagannorensis]
MRESQAQIIPFQRDGSYFYQKGIEAYQAKNLVKSKQLIEKAISMEPEEGVFHCQLAIVLSEMGEFTESNRCLSHLIQCIDTDMHEVHFFKGNNYIQMGEAESAEKALHLYLSRSENPEFKEDAEELLHMLEEEQAVTEEEDDPFTARSAIMLHAGNFETAVSYAEEFIERSVRRHGRRPREGVLRLAEAKWYLDERDEARTLVNEILDEDELDPAARALYTTMMYEEGQEGAAAMAEGLRSLYPMRPWDRYAIAKALYFTEQYEEAYFRLKKAIPGRMNIYMHQLGAAAWLSGRHGQAARCWDFSSPFFPKEEYNAIPSLADEEQKPYELWRAYE